LLKNHHWCKKKAPCPFEGKASADLRGKRGGVQSGGGVHGDYFGPARKKKKGKELSTRKKDRKRRRRGGDTVALRRKKKKKEGGRGGGKSCAGRGGEKKKGDRRKRLAQSPSFRAGEKGKKGVLGLS